MPLILDLGHYSETGPRERNEDRFGVVTPQGPDLSSKGVLLALADGVGGVSGGQEAAHYASRGLMADYYATPDTWPVSRALNQVLEAINRWILAEGRRQPELSGMACTMTALTLRWLNLRVESAACAIDILPRWDGKPVPPAGARDLQQGRRQLQ